MRTRCFVLPVFLLTFLLAATSTGLRADDHYEEIDVSFEQNEGYFPGSLQWQANWLVDGFGSQATVVEDAGEAPHGERFLRLTRTSGQPAIRVRNSKDRPFTPDGVISWYMKNNSLDARGDIHLRIPINGASSNLLQLQIQGEFNGEFRTGRIRYWQNEDGVSVARVTSVAFPRGEWMHWKVEFFSSDPSNPHMHITLTRVSDGAVLWAPRDLYLSESFKFNSKWGYVPEMVETVTAFDIVSIGTNPHDFSYDLLRAEISGAVPGGYAAWRDEHFDETEQQDELVSGPAADPGGHGIRNLVRYALGLDARHPEREGLPLVAVQPVDVGGVVSNYATLSFTRPKGLPDVIYVVQASGDLLSWADLDETHLVDIEDLGEAEQFVFRDSVPLSEASRRFLRLSLSLDEGAP